ncbi:hypothetical protein FCZ53_23540, partial [Escherichia coli]|nr:hypothetical protein [Escherichia coli]
MDWLLDVFATWLYGLKVIAITLAVIMFISGLDDFFIDVVYWVRRIKRKLSVYRPLQTNISQRLLKSIKSTNIKPFSHFHSLLTSTHNY